MRRGYLYEGRIGPRAPRLHSSVPYCNVQKQSLAVEHEMPQHFEHRTRGNETRVQPRASAQRAPIGAHQPTNPREEERGPGTP